MFPQPVQMFFNDQSDKNHPCTDKIDTYKMRKLDWLCQKEVILATVKEAVNHGIYDIK